jgi:hypothetical protein
VYRKSSKEFLSKLRAGNFSEAKAMFVQPTPNPPRTDLITEFCKTCDTSDVILTAKQTSRSRNRTTSTTALRGIVSRSDLSTLASKPQNPASQPSQS